MWLRGNKATIWFLLSYIQALVSLFLKLQISFLEVPTIFFQL